MPKKIFTYRIVCSFDMQFTFNESDVHPSELGIIPERPPQAADEDMEPTDEALERLGNEIKECLSKEFWVDGDVEVETSNFLGVETDG